MRWPEPETSIIHLIPARAHAGRARGRRGGIERLKYLSLLESSSPILPRVSTPMQVVCQAAPSESLTAGSLTGWQADGVRYSRAGIEIQRPREQPPFPTEFVSLVRARGGQGGGVGTPPRQERDVGQRGRPRGQRAGPARRPVPPDRRRNRSIQPTDPLIQPPIPGPAACAAGHQTHDAAPDVLCAPAPKRRSL